MSKAKFRELAAMIKDDLPGATELSRKRQAAAGGNPITVEIQLSMTLRYLAGGSYLDICRVNYVPVGSFPTIIKRTRQRSMVSTPPLLLFGFFALFGLC